MAAHIWANGRASNGAADWRRTAAKRARHRASSAADTFRALTSKRSGAVTCSS